MMFFQYPCDLPLYRRYSSSSFSFVDIDRVVVVCIWNDIEMLMYICLSVVGHTRLLSPVHEARSVLIEQTPMSTVTFLT